MTESNTGPWQSARYPRIGRKRYSPKEVKLPMILISNCVYPDFSWRTGVNSGKSRTEPAHRDDKSDTPKVKRLSCEVGYCSSSARTCFVRFVSSVDKGILLYGF